MGGKGSSVIGSGKEGPFNKSASATGIVDLFSL